ncbi:MAG: hypothetical protein HYX69_18910 [Planctomycetia bacterium]|nr:hypothetical protein [Planctomycetia bacterium]
MSKHWMIVAAIGQGVLFSLALTGAVRIACWLAGTTLADRVAGNLFLTSSLLTGAICGYLCVRSLNQAQRKASSPTPLGDRD